MDKLVKLKRRRKLRIRKKLIRKSKHPRLSVFRSGKHIYAQIIDDQKGITLVAVSDKELSSIRESEKPKDSIQNKNTEVKSEDVTKKITKVAKASMVGILLARKAKKKGITKIAFDRGAYKYHGRIKALAEAAKREGLKN